MGVPGTTVSDGPGGDGVTGNAMVGAHGVGWIAGLEGLDGDAIPTAPWGGGFELTNVDAEGVETPMAEPLFLRWL
jgi:hypothetical protein